MIMLSIKSWAPIVDNLGIVPHLLLTRLTFLSKLEITALYIVTEEILMFDVRYLFLFFRFLSDSDAWIISQTSTAPSEGANGVGE
jgi:hypothetical protein